MNIFTRGFSALSLATALSLAAGSAHAAPTTYELDPTHTNVVAQWSHFGFSNPIAHFGNVEGSLTYDPDNVQASQVEVVIPMSGLNSFSEAFDKHLRNADFFDVEKYPQASFKSTSVKPAGPGKLFVSGLLSIKDKTHPVVLDVVLNKAGRSAMTNLETIGFDATTTILRSDFDLDMHAPAVSDEVQIRITTEASSPLEE